MGTPVEEKTLEFVADVFRQAEGHKEKACLFIGAGCSASAGIPTAQGIVDEYFAKAQQYHEAYCCAEPKTYANCMRQLGVGEQRNLIERLVAGAKMNWAHIAIACLVRAGYVDRILTTNFDPLVMNACALIGEYPAVYDFAAAPIFISPMIARKAVFHLHGQSTGFVLVNTDEQGKKQFVHIGPLLRDSVAGRPVVVVGYSGENDPVFDHLSGIERFDFQLFWTGYCEEDPAAHVREKLLDAGRDAFFVRATDADRFFVGLAQNLKCFPPALIARPFSHLLEILAPIPPFPIPTTTTGQFDVLDVARGKIKTAIDTIEKEEPSKEKERHALLTAKFPATAAGLEGPAELKPEERELRALSLLQEGNQIYGKALQSGKEDADRLFGEAANKYEKALGMKPDMHEALYNWGNALSDQAQTKTGAEADRLFAAAGEKYERALRVKPDKHEALYNWGAALAAQAQTKTGAEADRLFAAANDRYIKCESIRPGHAAYNLACVASLCGREEDCEKWLEASKAAGVLPTRAHIEKDADLDPVRQRDWFKDFVSKLD